MAELRLEEELAELKKENAALRAEVVSTAEKLKNYMGMWKEAVAEREGIVKLMQAKIDRLVGRQE